VTPAKVPTGLAGISSDTIVGAAGCVLIGTEATIEKIPNAATPQRPTV